MRLTNYLVTIVVLLVTGCAIPPSERDAPATDTVSISSRPVNSPAVVELLNSARVAMDDRSWTSAGQFLERAIRIEPHNSALWHELARVRFEQGDYEQAQNLATRSNALLDSRSTLKKKNDQLIKASREALSF